MVRLLLLLATLAAPVGAAAASMDHPRLVAVTAAAGVPIQSLRARGFDVLHVDEHGDAIVLAWPGDLERLSVIGASVRIVDENPGATAARRLADDRAGAGRQTPERERLTPRASQGGPPPPVPGAGGMAGFWTLAEIRQKLDHLVANDPADVVADALDTLGVTGGGRPILGLRLGRTGPAAVYNALTHAREPAGMHALFGFVDHLLAGYGADPFATSLLDHRVIYIVPLHNPDGYAYNQAYHASSGTLGFWRKNTRDNNSSGVFDICCDGVDLNRNYGHQWAYNDAGSSPDFVASTYRGPAAFSEPETAAMRDLMIALQPVTALSFHSYSDMVLHAWNYTPAANPDELDVLEAGGDEMTLGNGYLGGVGSRILYQANGDFLDWCHGETTLKPRTYGWTVEVGSNVDGFWPPLSRIAPLAEENLRACYTTAAMAGAYVRAGALAIVEGTMDIGFQSRLRLEARNLGLGAAAGPGLAATLTPLDAGVWITGPQVDYPTLAPRASALPAGGAAFSVWVHDTVTAGRMLRFRVDFTAPDGLFSRDTIAIPAGRPTIVASDDASAGLGLWSPGSWGVVTGDPAHPSPYFADSPAGPYAKNATNRMLWSAPMNLTSGVHAYVLFESRWEFEPDYDGAVIEASRNGSSWTRLASTGTTPGSGISGGTQTLGLPVHAGSRRGWRTDRAGLSAFTGAGASQVRLRFQLLSDDGLQYDGFAFDAFRVELYQPGAQPVPLAAGEPDRPDTLVFAAPVPNPARGVAQFAFDLPRTGPVSLGIYDLAGRRVRTIADGRLAAGSHLRRWDLSDHGGARVPSGIYLARLRCESGDASRRIVVLP